MSKEQPVTDSEVVETEQVIETSKTPDRFIIDEEAENEVTEEVKETDEVKEEKVEEVKTDEQETGLQMEYEEDKLIISQGEEKSELIKVDFGDGKFGYVPEDLKDGMLMQSDYTRKTQALKTRESVLETEYKQKIESVEAKERELRDLELIDYLGGEIKKPDVKTYLAQVGDKYDTEEQAIADFDKETVDYNEQVKAKNKLELHQEQVIASNNQMVADFTAKYGEDEFKTIWNEIQKYLNPKVFKNIDPYPKDALEIFRKGMNYDADIEKAKKEAVITKEKERQAKSEKGTVIIKNKNTPKPKEVSTLPDRFNVIEN